VEVQDAVDEAAEDASGAEEPEPGPAAEDDETP
jgi:hypothetical protein